MTDALWGTSIISRTSPIAGICAFLNTPLEATVGVAVPKSVLCNVCSSPEDLESVTLVGWFRGTCHRDGKAGGSVLGSDPGAIISWGLRVRRALGRVWAINLGCLWDSWQVIGSEGSWLCAGATGLMPMSAAGLHGILQGLQGYSTYTATD